MTKMDACIYKNRQQETQPTLRHTGTQNINMQTHNNYTIQHETFMRSYEANSCFVEKFAVASDRFKVFPCDCAYNFCRA